MNNIEFFSGGMTANVDRVMDALNLWMERQGVQHCDNYSALKWALAKADTAHWYHIGDVVEAEPGKFAVVKEYMRGSGSYEENYLVAYNGSSRFNLLVAAENPDRYNPHIPTGILELAKNQLKAKCPLMGDCES